MASGTIALDEPAVTDKLLDTEELTVGLNTVQRERMRIAGAAATDLAPVTAADGLLVNLGANNDVVVTGVATEAKQDTGNSSLSSLDTKATTIIGHVDGIETLLTAIDGHVDALEGSAAAEAASLSIIDDWDESDRAKVNPIVGQAGVAANSGNKDALTQRVVLATDDIPLAAVNAVLGAVGDAAVSTDTTGSISAKLRGLLKLATTAGSFLTTISNSKRTQKAAASAAFTITLASLASSATWVAGQEGTAIATASFEPVLDFLVGGKITTGTTPTVSTFINVYIYASVNDTPLYPDVFDGTDSNETVTSENVRNSAIKLLATIVVDNTSDRTYWIAPTSVKSLFNGVLPTHFGVFVSHNTATNLHATGSNHAIYYTPVYKSQIA